MEEVRCVHCSGIVLGYSTLDVDNKTYRVCHPNTGLDCYKLMTVYSHDRWCFACTDVRIVLDSQVRLRVQ